MGLKRLLSIFFGLLLGLTQAADWPVESSESLRHALREADNGDRILFAPGRYEGNFEVRTGLLLEGRPGALVDALGQGNALHILAPNVTVRGLRITRWGRNLTDMNAGIFIARDAANVVIENNDLHGPAFGLWLDASTGTRVIGNRIQGVPSIRSQDRGNGIHLYAVTDVTVEGNEVWNTRDGIYIDTSNHNRLIGNDLHDVRYGIHYMYSHNNEVIGNTTYRTRTGYALMQSKYLRVENNVSREDQNYGILMNFITHSTLSGNRIEGVRQGTSPGGGQGIDGAEGKALFVYNSVFNRISNNFFVDSDLGIHLTAGSEDNELHGNAFIGNARQVKYVANRRQEWSLSGSGNYWSDYLGWDRDGDGIGDTFYEPNDGIDKLLWRQPAAKLLLSSPAVTAVRIAQRQFPVFKSPGVRDSHPLMQPPDEVSHATGD